MSLDRRVLVPLLVALFLLVQVAAAWHAVTHGDAGVQPTCPPHSIKAGCYR